MWPFVHDVCWGAEKDAAKKIGMFGYQEKSLSPFHEDKLNGSFDDQRTLNSLLRKYMVCNHGLI